MFAPHKYCNIIKEPLPIILIFPNTFWPTDRKVVSIYEDGEVGIGYEYLDWETHKWEPWHDCGGSLTKQELDAVNEVIKSVQDSKRDMEELVKGIGEEEEETSHSP